MKIYLTVGTAEGHSTVKHTEDMFQTLTYAGFPQHELYLGIRPHAKHEEVFWQKEFLTCYKWMNSEWV